MVPGHRPSADSRNRAVVARNGGRRSPAATRNSRSPTTAITRGSGCESNGRGEIGACTGCNSILNAMNSGH
eukprot:15454674-Alexandrium_andersonii.AAC.1